jgi:hypothetical protein
MTTIEAKRAKVTALVLATAVVICILFMVFAFMEKNRADSLQHEVDSLKHQIEKLK